MSRTYRKSPVYADKAFGNYYYCWPRMPGELTWDDLQKFVKENLKDHSCRWSVFPYSFSDRQIYGVKHTYNESGSREGYWKKASHRRARRVAKQCLKADKEIPKYKGNNGYGWV